MKEAIETRIIGEYDSGEKGPILFISAGVHGNEPSGVIALQKVFKKLKSAAPSIKGKVVGLVGNKKALKVDKRFIDEDLNRTWTVENIKSGEVDSHEKREMFDIINTINTYLKNENYGKRYFLDCHTTSSASIPYISVQEVNDNDAWAHRFPTYIIRGFSDIVKGCIDHYLSRSGITGFVFEGGQHTSPEAITNHEGMIWLAIENACNLELNTLDKIPAAVTKTKERLKDRKTFEIIYRHGIEKEDTFEMKPGYENFQKIEKNEVLAVHNSVEVKSDWDAYIFMPLYQKQGNDGFFVVQEVNDRA